MDDLFTQSQLQTLIRLPVVLKTTQGMEAVKTIELLLLHEPTMPSLLDEAAGSVS